MDGANTSFTDAGGNNENEANSEMSSRFRKQLPTKNFMSPTISATKKAAGPKKKILAERNETLDFVERTILSSKRVKFLDGHAEKDIVAKSSSQPYDPVTNYLAPRPKFLLYDPDRGRKLFVLQGNEEGIKSSDSFDGGDGIPSSDESELGFGSSGSTDCLSPKESLEEAEDKIDEEGELKDEEESEGEDDEEEIVEFEEDRWWSIKDFLKILFVAIAVILTTRTICSMNSPTPSSHILESIWSFNDWHDNVYGAAHSNFSGVVQDLVKETDLMMGRLNQEVVYHGNEGLRTTETIEEIPEINDPVSEEFENNEADVILDEMLTIPEDSDKSLLIEILQEPEIVAATEVVEINNIEAEIEVHDQPLRADSDANARNSQLTTDADFEIAKGMKIDDIETNQMTIKLASFDHVVAALIGLLILILTSFGVVYHSKQTESSSPVTTVPKKNDDAEKEELKDLELEPSPNPSCLMDEEPLNSSSRHIDYSKEISHIYAPSVELLGEFVFGGEVTSSFNRHATKDENMSAESNVSNSLIQAHTVKKEVSRSTKTSSMVAESTVRRSSRLQNRRSVMSP